MTATPRDPSAALDEVTRLVGYIRVSSGPFDGPDGASWVPAVHLVRDPTTLLARMRTSMDGRGIDRVDIGMSLFIQAYAFRIASVAIGAWIVSGGVLDVGPDNVAIQFGRNRPNAVRLASARWSADPEGNSAHRETTLAALHTHLVDGHFAELVDTAKRACQIGTRLLWSNIASSCASSFGAFIAPLTDDRLAIRSLAERFFASAPPPLAAGGEMVPVGSVWAWQRHACCLYYQHTSGSKCEDCSLCDTQERASRFERILAEFEAGSQQ